MTMELGYPPEVKSDVARAAYRETFFGRPRPGYVIYKGPFMKTPEGRAAWERLRAQALETERYVEETSGT